MPKTKLVGSTDGGFSCKGCYYYEHENLPITDRCTRPADKASCVQPVSYGRARSCIYIEDKEQANGKS